MKNIEPQKKYIDTNALKLEYNLIRSKRKSIAIHITKDASVEVRAPLKAAKTEIERFVISNIEWINKHLSAHKADLAEREMFTLNYGDSIRLQGNVYKISSHEGNMMGFNGEEFYLPNGLSSEQIKKGIIKIYKNIAKILMDNKVQYYGKILGVTPTAVKINGANTRWGSCSGKNSINFSWRLIIADDNVIDYVVVHELAHIIEHNHSERFWHIIESIIPDYKLKKKKLNELHDILKKEDWN